MKSARPGAFTKQASKNNARYVSHIVSYEVNDMHNWKGTHRPYPIVLSIFRVVLTRYILPKAFVLRLSFALSKWLTRAYLPFQQCKTSFTSMPLVPDLAQEYLCPLGARRIYAPNVLRRIPVY
jgi:hypothetical protein